MNIHVGPRTVATRLTPAYDLPDADTLLEFARDALTRPSDSYWRDDELWETHTFMFSHAPDSDDTIAESNHRSILRDLSAEYARHKGAIERAGFGHWTYSHFDTIKVRVIYANGEIHPAFADAVAIAIELRDNYPLYDETDHSDLECEYWDKAIDEEVNYAVPRALDDLEESEGAPLSESDADLFREDVREYLFEHVAYQSSEFWVAPEEMESAIDRAKALIGTVRPDDSFQTLKGL